MRILNLIWGFGLGGVRSCFLTYAGLGKIEPRLDIHSVCIDLRWMRSDPVGLKENDVEIVSIDSRLDVSWMAKCLAIVERVAPDVIFTHGFNGPVIAQALCCRYGLTVPMVCSYHSEYQAPSFGKRFLAPLYNGVMHWMYRRRATGVLAVSAFSRETLIQHGISGDKVAYVLHGIEDRPVARRPLQSLMPTWHGEGDEVILGVASRLDGIKGLSFLLDAVVIVRSQCHVHLVVVGDGVEAENLRSQAERLCLMDLVSFVGYQPNVSAWLETFDVFCLPSLSETLSLSLIEASRAGVAIVASRAGGIVEVVRDEQEALLVPPADEQALAQAIIRLAKDGVLRQALGVNARRRFEAEFTEARMRRQIADWLLSFDRRGMRS